MSRTLSPSTGRAYGVRVVLDELEIARSTYYAARVRLRVPGVAGKRGPRTPWSDAELLARIRQVLAESPFVGEGHRKAWAQLRAAGVGTAKPRVLRLMREANLLAPTRATRVLGPRTHDGTITTERPDRMWGTDLTTVQTRREGQAAVFVAVDHCTAEGVGIHAAKVADRFEALEPIRQGVRERFGAYDDGVAAGLALRHDNGSQYTSAHFQDELAFLGIESSPAFVRAPEGNGCAERFIRTLKEQLLWLKLFDTVEDLRLALHAWLKIYNERWLVERHGHRTPAQVRRDLLAQQVAA
jgi:transposase InsO family protein